MFMTKMRRTMREDEAGQALVIGAFSMLILALAVMMTIQIGHTIDQKITVQNAADNAAFSIAAVVARSLNFIAWVNRTSVAHYVAMMAFQSIPSFLTGIQTIMWLFKDLLQDIAVIACFIENVCALCKGVPIIGVICAACEIAFKIIHKVAKAAADVLKGIVNGTWEVIKAIDKIVALAVQGISFLNNNGHFFIQAGMKYATNIFLAAGVATNTFTEQIIQETAGTCNTSGAGTANKIAMAALNGAVSYPDLFDSNPLSLSGSRKGSEDIPSDGTDPGNYKAKDRVQNAERLMTEISNASRTGFNGAHDNVRFVSYRGWDKNSANIAAKALSWLGVKFQGSTRLVKEMTCKKFCENRCQCDSGAAFGGGGGMNMGGIGDAMDKCKQKQQTCKDYDNNVYKPAQAKCNQDRQNCNNKKPACNATGPDPSSSACQAQASACDTADASCDDAADKKDEGEDICEKAEDDCKKLQDFENAGGGEGADATSNAQTRNYIWGTGEDTSMFSRGGVIASAEYVKASGLSFLSGAGGKMVGIQTHHKEDADKAFHCRFKDDEDDRTQEVETGICPEYCVTKDVYCLGKNDDGATHKWYGIGKYVSFNSTDDKDKMFGQPSFFALVNKAPADARFPADLAFGFTQSGGFTWDNWKHADMEGANKPGLSGAGSAPLFGDGLNAIARSMVYYHRPGAWAEPPNLFNPFWKAKLGPVSAGSKQLLASNGLGGANGLLGPLFDLFMLH